MATKYRTEAFFGSGVRDAVEVMAFEINTLGNTDILRTLGTGLLQGTETGKEMLSIAEQLDADGEGAEDLFYIKDLCREALKAIEAKTGVQVKYALWLAEYDDVLTHFWAWAFGASGATKSVPKPEDGEIEAYEIGPVILSAGDGAGGMLYGYSNMPHPLAETDKGESANVQTK